MYIVFSCIIDTQKAYNVMVWKAVVDVPRNLQRVVFV